MSTIVNNKEFAKIGGIKIPPIFVNLVGNSWVS